MSVLVLLYVLVGSIQPIFIHKDFPNVAACQKAADAAVDALQADNKVDIIIAAGCITPKGQKS